MNSRTIMKSRRSIGLFFIIAVIFQITNATAVVEKPNSEDTARLRNFPHCGLYCVYALINAAGTDKEFNDLLVPQYISSDDGSSLYELKRAILDNSSLKAECVGNMTTYSLKNCHYPAILHVKSANASKYDHYLLYLGTYGDTVRVFDPPQLVRDIPMRELSFIWDGNAMIASNEAINVRRIFYKEYIMILSALFTGVLMALTINKFKRKLFTYSFTMRMRTCISLVQSTIILGLSVLLGFCINLFLDGGMLSYHEATERVKENHRMNFVSKINAKELFAILSKNEEVVVVDARFENTYGEGHLEGAVSIPVDANDDLFGEKTAGFTNKRIIVYCQSSGCKYAENVASRLIENGITNISIFRGGWIEWQKYKQSQPEKTQ